VKQPWIYKVVTLKPALFGVKNEQAESELNRLGLQGWELVNALQVGMSVTLYLKKPG